MPPSHSHVDVAALYAALEAEKHTRGMSWRQLARDCQLSPSTFTRMANGLRPDVDAFAGLVRWLGQPAEAFMTTDQDVTGATPDVVASLAPLLRARKDLTEGDVQHLQVLFTTAMDQYLASRDRG